MEEYQKTEDLIKVKVSTVVKHLQEAIKDYDLKNLIEKAKTDLDSLTSEEKDKLYGGLIKFGEALTFCRWDFLYSNGQQGLNGYASKFVPMRNHLIHHQMYHIYHPNLGNNKLKELIKDLPKITPEMEKNLVLLAKIKGNDYLSKPIRKGNNDFPFEFSHHVICLEKEIEKLEEINKYTSEEIDNNFALKTKFDNCVRNILTILHDLTSDSNENFGKEMSDIKSETSHLNYDFASKNGLASLFLSLNENRNSLCHLDPSITKPYTDSSQLKEFSSDLMKLKGNYILELKKICGIVVENKISSTAKINEKLLDSPVVLSQNKRKPVPLEQKITKKPRIEKKEVKDLKNQPTQTGLFGLFDFFSTYNSPKSDKENLETEKKDSKNTEIDSTVLEKTFNMEKKT